MKVYEIYDEENNISLGALLYFEKEKTFIVELLSSLDEWTAPLLFTGFVKDGIYTIPRDISFLWVKERIIPNGRQNIGAILNNHRMKAYDEMKFLEIGMGKCSHDSLIIRKTEDIPEFVRKRMKGNLKECLITDDYIICFFADGMVKKVRFTDLEDIKDTAKIMRNPGLRNSGKVGTGGYYITFNDSIDVPATELKKRGRSLDVSLDDFKLFVKKNIYDTQQACSELECSRQNLSYLVREGLLEQAKENVKGSLYLKGDVLKNKW
ncbi:MAG: hypothetical protein IK152_06790 [Lachnospiraceae bacterium]|nr:hypothetical protein [Lachnospiraceae bacterium]